MMRLDARRSQSVWLDYKQAEGREKLLLNLSAVAVCGEFLWTASDEGRSIECLEASEGGYRLREQVSLDAVFEGIPGGEGQDEVDIESMDVAGGRLWICGSHCRVRRKSADPGGIDHRLRDRPSRCLLGAAKLKRKGEAVSEAGEALAFKGPGSLRNLLAGHEFVAPFVALPTKENGLDIEGMSVLGGKVLLGLRGPLVNGIAIVVSIPVADDFQIEQAHCVTHFLDLGGLGVRDLARWDRHLLLVAGPVSSADGPFRLHHWNARQSPVVQKPEVVFEWPHGERPEGICRLDRGRSSGLLVVYDKSDQPSRISGSRYRADWIPCSTRR